MAQQSCDRAEQQMDRAWLTVYIRDELVQQDVALFVQTEACHKVSQSVKPQTVQRMT